MTGNRTMELQNLVPSTNITVIIRSIKKDKMSRTRSTHEVAINTTEFQLESLERRLHSRDFGAEGKIILKCI